METPVQVKIKFMVRGEPDGKTLRIRLVSISETSDTTNYVFPYEYQTMDHHPELNKLQIVKRTCACLKKRDNYRNIKITLPEEISPLYLDSDHNFVFKGDPLEELQEDEIENPESNAVSNFEKIVNKIQKRTENLESATRSFVLEIFKGKSQNAEYWLQSFENECDRHNILSDEKKIEAIRLFLAENGREWFTAAHVKLSSFGTWTSYRKSFLETFSDKGWVNVRMAFAFKFLGGSLLDYALRKEKLLLEVDPHMPVTTRIYLIVIGLPIYIQDRIDRDKIVTTEDLMGNVRKLESLVSKKPQSTIDKNLSANSNRMKKTPCIICKRMGKPGRFHPTELCRNKIRSNEIKSVNNLEMEERLNLQITDQKN